MPAIVGIEVVVTRIEAKSKLSQNRTVGDLRTIIEALRDQGDGELAELARLDWALRDAFDALYLEGETAPKMMSIGLHCRVVGKPGRIGALRRFLEHVVSHDRVWVARRIDIARHWIATHPYKGAAV